MLKIEWVILSVIIGLIVLIGVGCYYKSKGDAAFLSKYPIVCVAKYTSQQQGPSTVVGKNPGIIIPGGSYTRFVVCCENADGEYREISTSSEGWAKAEVGKPWVKP